MNVDIYPRHKEFENLLELYPPVLANKFLPEWYKSKKLGSYFDLINSDDAGQNAKNCPAIQDEITNGIIIPSWSDVYIFVDSDGVTNWNVKVGGSYSSEHNWIAHQSFTQIEDMNLNSVHGFDRDWETKI